MTKGKEILIKIGCFVAMTMIIASVMLIANMQMLY
jgi:hypothetical protein